MRTADQDNASPKGNGRDAVLRKAAARKQRMSDFPSPLPLAAFEEYMLWDDRPQYPMSIIARLRFAGHLQRRATAEALETVVARHPLLRATIHRTAAGRLEWIAGRSCSGIALERRPGRRSFALDAADRPVLGTGIEGLGHDGCATQLTGRCKCITRPAMARACCNLPTTSCEAMPAPSMARTPTSSCRPAMPRPCADGRLSA